MPSKSIAIPVLLTLALAGCQSARHKAEPAPPPQNVTTGSTFTVTRDFLMPSGDSRVYFQDGRLYPQGEVRPDYPFCEFAVAAATTAGQVIHAGILTVGNVEYDEEDVGPGGVTVSVTELGLQEVSSGKSYRMSCMLPLLSIDARFVTPAEIQSALGEYMKLQDSP